MMNEIEKWLEINTFVCPHGLGRISPEQCEANRKRPEEKEAILNEPLKPTPCKTCKEWKQLVKEVYDRRNSMSKGICKNCQQERTIKARGLCSSCYDKLKKEGKLPEPSKPGRQKSSVKVVVDFSRCPFIYEIIKQKAEEEMRDLSTQILWELKKALSNKNVEGEKA